MSEATFEQANLQVKLYDLRREPRQHLRGHEWRLRLGRSQFLSRGRSQEFDERVGRLF